MPTTIITVMILTMISQSTITHTKTIISFGITSKNGNETTMSNTRIHVVCSTYGSSEV